MVATLCAALAEKSQQKKPHLQQLCPNLAASCQQPQRQQNAAKNPKTINTGKVLLMTLTTQDMCSFFFKTVFTFTRTNFGICY